MNERQKQWNKYRKEYKQGKISLAQIAAEMELPVSHVRRKLEIMDLPGVKSGK